eukprot:TRINITY_DN10858_c0_g1_i1.p1 TRINITY_DN10858_c0_g1~~TRINITY_DN10858_c0_g1_i1.p1  ORF type:complete len:520 (+),score=189.65 TRINITY_DN10858_c0_g1_i1:34-1593(+)
MYDPLTKLVGQIVSDAFGETAAHVATDIASFSVKTFSQILSSTQLSIKEVRAALGVLVQNRMVTFDDKRKPGTVDYYIQMDNIISYLRYPKFLYLVKTTYGDEAEIMVEEIIKSGSESATNVLFKTSKRLNETLDDVTQAPTISDLHKKFNSLIASHLIERCEELGQTKAENTALLCPNMVENKDLLHLAVEVDVKAISAAVVSKSESVEQGQDKAVLWRLDIAKCDLLLRNKMIVDAAARRLDEEAGKVVSSLLKILERWADAAVSSQFSHSTISEQVAADHGKDSLAHIYLDQYLRVLADDKTRFVDRVGDSGGGQYHVDLKYITTCLVESTLDCVVLEKFSSKAVRVFRYIREKRFVEESQLQQVVMIPAKETKMLTYQLLENHFIHLQELRKSVAPTAPSKAFYLFYVDLPQVVRTCVSVCYKSMYNCRNRAKFEAVENARLLDKHERIESIAASLRASGGTEEQLEEVAEMMTPPEKEAVKKIHLKLDKLSKAQAQADETLFVFKLYLNVKCKS